MSDKPESEFDLLHRCDSAVRWFSCAPSCTCGWTDKPLRGLNYNKIFCKAVARYGQHLLEEHRLANPAFWLEVDSWRTRQVTNGERLAEIEERCSGWYSWDELRACLSAHKDVSWLIGRVRALSTENHLLSVRCADAERCLEKIDLEKGSC